MSKNIDSLSYFPYDTDTRCHHPDPIFIPSVTMHRTGSYSAIQTPTNDWYGIYWSHIIPYIALNVDEKKHGQCVLSDECLAMRKTYHEGPLHSRFSDKIKPLKIITKQNGHQAKTKHALQPWAWIKWDLGANYGITVDSGELKVFLNWDKPYGSLLRWDLKWLLNRSYDGRQGST